jgi:two-component system LytT family response regulator
MINTILVDDEPRGISTLRHMLEMNCPDVKIIDDCGSADEAREKIELLKPNLVFLDIVMPGKTSLQMLNELPSIDFEIIFVTAHNEYTIQAFKFSAVDYLLKPVDEDLLTEAVKKAEKRIAGASLSKNVQTLIHNVQKKHSPFEMKLCIPSLKGFQVVEIENIIYCEAESSYTIFHLTNNQKITASKSIIEYEMLLQDSGFLRVHKSFMINMHHIKEYQRGEGGTVVLSNNLEVEVSRRKKDAFIAKMKELYKF